MRRAVVTSPSLNLRSTPTTAEAPIGSLTRGEVVTLLETSNRWYQVKTADGATGFVHGDFVRPLETNEAIGFLHEDPVLGTVPRPPSESDRIGAQAGSTAAERRIARLWNRNGGLLDALSERLGIDPAASIAVALVEAGGTGFGADGRLIIRFENHVFHRRWGHAHPARFDRHFRFDPSKRWQGHRLRLDEASDWETFHGTQAGEWRAFELALGYDRDAAFLSISMGGPQIMGFNHAVCGYASAEAMFDRFQDDARYQILGGFDFVKGPGATSDMLEALRLQDFERFAARYNGPGQAAAYGDRIAGFFATARILLDTR